ncbi:hypothetical protein CHLRE_10g449800v5 [Chlamydomonas reinhardtii]|uniref:Uncharacterized protein n=1 Tax=Chlamydomonas reinhardtii TaxID=3055 RepID=A0A2K3DB35_CHLRE|nr:uncharacterized protein CHLRE_10g449800v5 [Chlamydomonas reinhardtii]PNW77744.1 hypothetical protein CHLRE_10g449800v5 [Chlamydomonas reinhardtii]
MVAVAYVVGCVFAGLSGALLATQSGINSTLGAAVGKSFAAVVSFAVGLGALLVFFAIDTAGLGHKGPSLEAAAAVPWWGWVGGFLGAFYVAVVVVYAPVLGAATLMALFVCCQLATAVLLDSMGWVGFRKRSLHWARLVGLGLMLAGVVLVTYFDGSTAAPAPAPAPPPLPGQPPGQPLTASGPVASGRALAEVASPLYGLSDSTSTSVAGGVTVALATYSKESASAGAVTDSETGAPGERRSGAAGSRGRSGNGSSGDCQGTKGDADANV